MCFSLLWFVQLIVLVICIVGAVKIFNVVWPIVVGWMGGLGTYADAVARIVKILIVMLILIWLVWFAYQSIECALGMGGGPRLFGK